LKARGNINTFDTFEIPPPTVDWVKDGFKTAVRNQGRGCGSCYAFAAMGAMEGAHYVATGKLLNLSVSHCLDCAVDDKNQIASCKGGWPEYCFNYFSKNAATLEEHYTYKNETRQCRQSEIN